jgi:hypothetical protein
MQPVAALAAPGAALTPLPAPAVDADGDGAGGVGAGGVDAGGVDAGGVDAGGVAAGGVDAGGVEAGGTGVTAKGSVPVDPPPPHAANATAANSAAQRALAVDFETADGSLITIEFLVNDLFKQRHLEQRSLPRARQSSAPQTLRFLPKVVKALDSGSPSG